MTNIGKQANGGIIFGLVLAGWNLISGAANRVNLS